MYRRTMTVLGMLFILGIIAFLAWNISTKQALASGQTELSQETAVLDSLIAIVQKFDEIYIPPTVKEVDKLWQQLDTSPKTWTDEQNQRLILARTKMNHVIRVRNSAADAYNRWVKYLQTYKKFDLSKSGFKYPREIILVN